MNSQEISLNVAGIVHHLQLGKIYLVGKKSGQPVPCLIALTSECNVDSKHAIIEVHNGATATVSVLDLCSYTGTFLNGQRLDAMNRVKIHRTAALWFGNVAGELKIKAAEDSPNSSGFHDGTKNTSNLSLSPATTPQQQAQKKGTNIGTFLLPAVPTRSANVSLQENSDANTTADSFRIPDTQFAEKRASLPGGNISIAGSDAGVGNDSSDDSFIPETQQVESAISCSQRRKLPPASNVLIHTAEEMNEVSQFRICTQDFNENVNVDLFDSDSDDIFGDVHCSLTIPHIVHPPVKLNESTKKAIANVDEDFAEMSALNWTATENSKCTENERDRELDNCTPDLFDLPDLAQENAKEIGRTVETPKQIIAKGSPNAIEMTEASTKSNAKESGTDEYFTPSSTVNNNSINGCSKGPGSIVTAALLDNDEDDLIPTQLFDAAANNKQQHKKAVEFEELQLVLEEEPASAVHLTLSNKENLPIDVKSDASNETTQIFPGNNVTVKDTPLPQVVPTSTTEDDTLPATQVFAPLKKLKIKSAAVATANERLNSTLLQREGKHVVRTAASFFEDMETTQKLDTSAAFKIPEAVTTVRKTSSTCSSTSSTTSLAPAPTETSMELLMNTPHFIKEQFDEYTKECDKETSLIAQQRKALFGDDSEEEDVLKLINAPKVAHDFDSLLPHLTRRSDPEAQPRTREEGNRPKSAFMFGQTDKKGTKSRDISRSRDDRHLARDKERSRTETEQQQQQRRTATAEQSHTKKAKDSKARSSRDTANDADKSLERAKGAAKSLERAKDADKSLERTKEVKKEAVVSKSASVLLNSDSKAQKTYAKLRSSSPSTDREEKLQSQNKSRQKEELKRPKQKEIGETKAKASSASANNDERQMGRRLRTKSQTQEKEQPQPLRRTTRLKTYIEKSSTVCEKPTKMPKKQEEDKQAPTTKRRLNSHTLPEHEHVTADNVSKRLTRSRSTTESQESSCSSGVTKPKLERKRKITPAVPTSDDNSKRLRSRCSQDGYSSASSSSNATSKAATKLKVSMTMVDPMIFERLSQDAAGFWSIAKDPVESDVLIMDKGNRTYKFLLAMARGIPIVTSKWLECVNKTQRLAHSAEYFFADAAFEKRHKFSLLRSLEAARKQPLLKDYVFLMTPNILPSPSEMKAIILSAGGTVLDEPLAAAAQPQQLIYLISASSDKKHWHKYRRVSSQLRIISTEGVMAAVMRQSVLALEANMLA